MKLQMIRVISSPSSSATGLATLILGMPATSSPPALSLLPRVRSRKPAGAGGGARVTTVSAGPDQRPAGRRPERADTTPPRGAGRERAWLAPGSAGPRLTAP